MMVESFRISDEQENIDTNNIDEPKIFRLKSRCIYPHLFSFDVSKLYERNADIFILLEGTNRLNFLHSGAILLLNTAVTPLNNAQLDGYFFALQGLSVLENYTKPPLTLNEQLQNLKNRGLLVDDDELALFHLEKISYYRLSAYWHPFRKIEQDGSISDKFEERAHLNDVIGLYEFDRRLRLQVMDAIERFEVYARALFVGVISHKYGAFGHTEATNFYREFDHDSWLEKLEIAAENSREAFVLHYKSKYCGFPTLPIWMLTELMPLGSLSRAYEGIEHVDKRSISSKLNLHYELLASWFHTLTYIRNICSHHSRLWNRKLVIRPRHIDRNNWDVPVRLRNDKIFYVLLILRYLLRNLHVSDEWKKQMNALLEPVAQNERWRKAMGMPEDWKNHPIWQ